MPEFNYEGIDKAGKKVSGKFDAPSEGELRMNLRGIGVRPTKIYKTGTLDRDIFSILKGGMGKVPTESIVIFTRQLQVLIGAGIPLVQGFDILIEQSVQGSLKNILIAVKEKISQGSYLWEALSAYPRVFPKLYVSLIRAGEASGTMDGMLKRVSKYLEDSNKMRKILKSAMMYPIIVISIATAVISLMLIFVIPKFEEILASNNQALPAVTQFVINTSHFLVRNIVYILIYVGFSIFIIFRYTSSDEGKAFVDRITFRLPLIGPVIQKAGVARFSRTMQTLLASGVNLIDAIDICKATIDNAVLEDAVSKIRSEVESGKTLGTVVSRLEVFPRMAVQMISVGESTGNLDKMLEKVADFFEEEVETMISGMTKLIEPFVLVFLGCLVGGMMIAMYLPIFKLAGGGE